MTQKSDTQNLAGALAEFSALRAEIIQQVSEMWSIFALQLTTAAVIFSFALSSAHRTGFLLVLPMITCALSGRYMTCMHAVRNIAEYIMEGLSPRVPGGLDWEVWSRRRPLGLLSPASLLDPNLFVFPGLSLVALTWLAPYVWLNGYAVAGNRHLLFIALWILDTVLTVFSFELIRRSTSRFWRQRVANTNLPEK